MRFGSVQSGFESQYPDNFEQSEKYSGGVSEQTALLASGIRTAESCFYSNKNRRAGAQTKLFDEKVLVEGEIPSSDN